MPTGDITQSQGGPEPTDMIFDRDANIALGVVIVAVASLASGLILRGIFRTLRRPRR